MTQPIPEGFHTVTPHLVVKGAARAIEFYESAFGAEKLFTNCMDETGQVLHGRIRIGDSIVMLNDEFPEHGCLAPAEGSRPAVTVHLYVEDCDALYARSVAAGAETVMPPTDMFWGDRYAQVKDPFGHVWSIATCVEELCPEELEERAKKTFVAD